MLKLSEIGKLSQQFANTCCYKNLQSHTLAARKCCPNGSSASAARSANEPIRINQRAGLCQLGRNDISCCTKCNEINQCIWSASKNSSFFVPDQATPWYEKQRESRLNRHTLLEQCQCYGISSFVPPEECLKLRARACMRPLDPNKFKRISPEFLKLLQNYEYLMARYDPKYDRSGYCKRPAKIFLQPSQIVPARSQSAGKTISYAVLKDTKKVERSKTPQASYETLSVGHPKAHGFERPARVVSKQKLDSVKKSAAKDTKTIAPKSESGKKSPKPSRSPTPGTSKAAKQGKNEKKRWSLFSKQDKQNDSEKSKSKSGKAPVRELWSKPNATEMRESGGSIEMYRGKSKHRGLEDINTDTYNDAPEGSLIKMRPQIRYRENGTSHELSERSRSRTSSKHRSASDREPSDTPLDLKPRVHGNFDIPDTVTGKKRSSPKTSSCKKLLSSRSASTDRERMVKKRSHSLHSKASVTELNPSVHGYSQYRDVGRYRNSPFKPRRQQSRSPSKYRIPSDRDDDSDVSLAPRVHKQRNISHAHKTYATSYKRPAPSTHAKSCKRSASKKDANTSLAPRVHAFKDNPRNTKLYRERSPSTAPESSSCGRRKNIRYPHHTPVTRKRSPLSTPRGRARKKAISTSASTDSLAPRVHGYRRQQDKCSDRQKYSYSRSQVCRSTTTISRPRKYGRSPSNSDSMASISPPQVHGYRYEKPRNRVSLLEPPNKKSLRYEASPMKIKPKHKSSESKFKSAVYLRPGLHGYRNHALTNDENTSPKETAAKDKQPQLPSTSIQNQQELPQQTAQKKPLYSPSAVGQTKRKPPKHTTIAAFTTHVRYNPDKQDSYCECYKSSSAQSIDLLHRSQGSSSPLTSDSSRSYSPKSKNSMGRSFPKSICSNCRVEKKHCFCDPNKNDPRFLKLQKIHHYQDIPPEKFCCQPNLRPEKYVNSSSILRKCHLAQGVESDTGLSSEREECFTRFSEISNNISKQSCCTARKQGRAADLPSNQELKNQIHVGYMSDFSKFNGENLQDDQMEPDVSKSSQESRQNALKNVPRGDTSPNPKRHANCYKDSFNWTYADEQFPSRYRLQGEKSIAEAHQLEQHKARNQSKSRLDCPCSEEDEESVDRHKACSKDAYDWSEATKNYPIRYQQAAKDAAAERSWRAKHMKKMHSMSQCTSEGEDRHTMCSRDAYDWADVTENYPLRYQEAAARQEADKAMLERHTARRHSRSPNPIPGVCPERHTACFNDSTDWRNATINYPIRYRIAALEAASGRKFHTRRNLWEPRREQSSSPNSSPNRYVAPTSPDRTQRLRSPNRNGSPTNRSRAPSSSRKEDNADDRGYRPQLHGLNYQRAQRSRSPRSHPESKEDGGYMRRRYPMQYQTQQQCASRKKSPASSDDNEPSHHRFKVGAGGYYKSPSYLSDPTKSRIPIANKYSQKQAASKMRTDSTTDKENKPTRKNKTENICGVLRPDYILGQQQSFRM